MILGRLDKGKRYIFLSWCVSYTIFSLAVDDKFKTAKTDEAFELFQLCLYISRIILAFYLILLLLFSIATTT